MRRMTTLCQPQAVQLREHGADLLVSAHEGTMSSPGGHHQVGIRSQIAKVSVVSWADGVLGPLHSARIRGPESEEVGHANGAVSP